MKTANAAVQARVDRLFDRFERMTDAELMLLRSVWEEQDGSAREQAWTMVKATLRHWQTQGLLDQARDRVASWVNNYPAPMVIGDVPAIVTGSGMDPGSIRKAAADGLSAHELTVLLEPVSRLAPHTITR